MNSGGDDLVLMANEFEPEKGNLLTTLPILHKTFSFRIEVMLLGPPTGQWRNVVHVTKGEGSAFPGDRMPLISFHPNDNRIQVGSYVNGQVNFPCDSKIELELGQWYKIETKQVFREGKYFYSVLSPSFSFARGGQNCQDVENVTPTDFTEMRVYVSHPWGDAANAQITNFVFSTTCKINRYLKVLVKLT